MAYKGTDPLLCEFGYKVLRKFLHEFSRQLPGVRHAEDPEYIHQMRVSSRRLRAALPIFRECYSKKEYRQWRREMRRVTRILGSARDLDVQIMFLESYAGPCNCRSGKRLEPLRKIKNKGEAPEVAVPGTINMALYPGDVSTGIAYIRQYLEIRRKSVQPQVIDALDHLEQSRTIVCMEQSFGAIPKKTAKVAGKKLKGNARNYAAESLISALDDLLHYETTLFQPEAKTAHHAMRIAVKQLRYRMEIFSPLYAGMLAGPVRVMKRLQTLLGDLHDCDVWIGMLPGLSIDPQSGCEEEACDTHRDEAVFNQVQEIIEELIHRRKLLYEQVIRYWKQISRKNFFPLLHSIILAGGQEADDTIPDPSPAAGDGTQKFANIR